MQKILIVGGNAAGMTAGSRARRLDPRAEITILEQAPFISYSTCGIPNFLTGEVSREELIRFTPAELAQERRIAAETETRVEEILPSRKRVLARRISTGETLTFRYDRLLIATGVKPRMPDIPGTSRTNVFSIVTLEDAVGVREALGDSRRVIVVGAGYVGLEMAESFRKLGKDVVLYERNPHVLSSVDPDMARIIEYEVRRHGVQLRTGSPVEAIVGDGDRATGVKARGALAFQPGDGVLLDTGVNPNVDLAESAGVQIGSTGGIAVNAYMETNVAGVFAAGNCSEVFCMLRRRPVVHHLGTVAVKQGRVAGENLTGRRSTFSGSVGTTVLKVFDLAVGRSGLSSGEARSEQIRTVAARIEALDRTDYLPGSRKMWVKLIVESESRRVIGAQAIGYGDVSRQIDVAATAITASLTVDELAQLDLGYTPPYSRLWDPLLVAAHSILRKL